MTRRGTQFDAAAARASARDLVVRGLDADALGLGAVADLLRGATGPALVQLCTCAVAVLDGLRVDAAARGQATRAQRLAETRGVVAALWRAAEATTDARVRRELAVVAELAARCWPPRAGTGTTTRGATT